MCFAELLETLQTEGLNVNESKIRAALRSGRLTRPRLDRSNRFIFEAQHLKQLRKLFADRGNPAKQGALS